MLIRADASAETGTGHIMRCLALAQAWKDAGGSPMFALAQFTPAILARLAVERIEAVPIDAQIGSSEDAECTVEVARSGNARWIVLDGYTFDAAFQERIRSSDAKVLFIDDIGGCEFYSANIVLNQNLGASQHGYAACSPRTRLLLGPEFVLLRREFKKWIGCERTFSRSARTLLISMGGSDPTDLTCKIAGAGGFDRLRTAFLFGGSARPELKSPDSPSVACLKDEADMANILAESDIAVICAGGTLWESLFMGCATLSYTRNAVQKNILQTLQQIGAVEWLGEVDNFDRQFLATRLAAICSSERRRKAMSRAGRKIIDGRGTERVLCALKSTA